MNSLQTDRLLRHLGDIMEDISKGDSSRIDSVFELTREDVYPPEISRLAESFGMMIVNIDARQQRLERLLAELQEKNRELEQLSGNLMEANVGMLEVLGSAIAKRDSDTSAHNYRVTIHSIYLGKAMGLDDAALHSLIKGAFLHDIGKIAISDNILHKPARLDELEFNIIKSHVHHGSEIIKSYAWLSDANDVVLHHHEKYNGTGYPDRLKGDCIPLNARIFAIADVFDALISRRPYKEPCPFDEVMDIMSADAGSHFDPEIFAVFCKDARRINETIAGYNEASLKGILHTILSDSFGRSEVYAG